MLTCPQCDKEVKMLVIPHEGRLGCRDCAGKVPKRYNVNLGQTVEQWTHIDKHTTNEIKHKLTVGKNWEIDNRIISKDDPKVVINRVTGKPSQY